MTVHRKHQGVAACDICGCDFEKKAANHRICPSVLCKRKAKRDRQMKVGPGEAPAYRPYVAPYRDPRGKECTLCHEYRMFDDFHQVKKNADGHSSQCRYCTAQQAGARYHAARSHPETAEQLRLSRKAALYRVSVNELLQLELTTNCDLCGCEFDGKRPCIDHCHETGLIRGVLCTPCNTSLGKLGDSYESAMNAAAYLLKRVDVLALASQVEGNF